MLIERGALHEMTPVPDSVLTLGSFDGLHLAHQALIRRVVVLARAQGSCASLLTFEPHPREVLLDNRPAVTRLTLLDEKLQLLEALGLDRVLLVRFTAELASWEARRFIQEGLMERIGFHTLVIGQNHAFGRDRGGNSSTLKALSRELGFKLEVLDPVLVGNAPVSSTRLRHALAEGRMELAAELLGRPWQLTGRVEAGRGRGRLLGIPTANLTVPEGRLLAADGVYAVRVQLEDGRNLDGMLNLGPRPTFGEGERVPEVHLFDFEGDLYNQMLRVDLLTFIRDTMRFTSGEQLAGQLRMDRNRIQEWLKVARQEAGLDDKESER